MNRKLAHSFVVLVCLWGVTSFPNAVQSSENQESSISIRIYEPELFIESVQFPSFGRYLTNDEEQVVNSNSDFVINVTDKRADKKSWKLKYSLSVLNNEEEKIIGNSIQLDIGKGKLYSQGEELKSTDYIEEEVETFFDNACDLVKTSTQLATTDDGLPATYSYVVDKSQVNLELPSNIAAGVYKAIQTVTLESTPIAD